MDKTDKQKEGFFTQMEFNDAIYAQNFKEKYEQKLVKCKLGLLIALITEIIWILRFVILPQMPIVVINIAETVAIIGAILSYAFGGGFGLALGVAWKMAKTIGWIGWCCVSFPADIITGVLLTIFAIIFIPMIFIFIPLVIVFCNYLQINRNIKEADEFLKCCVPVETYGAE